MVACLFGGRGLRWLPPAVGLVAAVGVICVGGPAGAAVAGQARPAAGIISTVAGGVGGPGKGPSVAVQPCGLKFTRGALYIGGGSVVRRVNPRTGWLTTPVAHQRGLCGLTLDRAGNVLEAREGPIPLLAPSVRVAAVRSGRFYGRRMTAGKSYPIVDQLGIPRLAGESIEDGGPAINAFLSSPADVELDRAGNLVVADAGSPPDRGGPPLGALVRVVAERSGRFYGRRMTAGHIYTVAGVQAPRRTVNGSRATRAWLGMTIGTVRTDAAGNLIVADGGTQGLPRPIPLLASSVRVVAVRSGRFYGQQMTAGHIYVIAGNGHFGSSGNGGRARQAALACAAGVAIDHAGNVVVADCGQVRVVAVRSGRFYGRKMTAGHIYRIAGSGPAGDSGDGRSAVRAHVDATGVTIDGVGNVAVADDHDLVVRLIATRTGRFYGRTMRSGDIYRIAGNGRPFSGDGGPATRAEIVPLGVARDHAGDLVIGDSLSGRVQVVPAASGRLFGRRMTRGDVYAIGADVHAGRVALDQAGNVLVLGQSRVYLIAARSGRFYGQKRTVGHTYVIAGDGSRLFSGDGGPATAAGMTPSGLAVDAAGSVLIADGLNSRVRVIATTSGTFYGQPMTAGNIYTIAGDGTSGFSGDGGPALSAELSFILDGMTTDHAGNVLITDNGNARVRVIAAASGTFYGQPMTAGDIYTIAGGGRGPAGDGGPATKASVNPGGVAVDGAGNVLIADMNNRIRVVAVASGTFYGQHMTAGDIYTMAGTSQPGFSGDGGPAIRATLNEPFDVTVGRAGSVLLVDLGNNRVRSVSG